MDSRSISQKGLCVQYIRWSLWIMCPIQHKGPNDSVFDTQKGKCVQYTIWYLRTVCPIHLKDLYNYSIKSLIKPVSEDNKSNTEGHNNKVMCPYTVGTL